MKMVGRKGALRGSSASKAPQFNPGQPSWSIAVLWCGTIVVRRSAQVIPSEFKPKTTWAAPHGGRRAGPPPTYRLSSLNLPPHLIPNHTCAWFRLAGWLRAKQVRVLA